MGIQASGLTAVTPALRILHATRTAAVELRRVDVSLVAGLAAAKVQRSVYRSSRKNIVQAIDLIAKANAHLMLLASTAANADEWSRATVGVVALTASTVKQLCQNGKSTKLTY